MSKSADLIRRELIRAMPFTFIENVDVTQKNYIVSPDICVCEIQCNFKGSIKIDTIISKGKIVTFESGETRKIGVTKIYTSGTDSSCANKIVLYGHTKDELQGTE